MLWLNENWNSFLSHEDESDLENGDTFYFNGEELELDD